YGSAAPVAARSDYLIRAIAFRIQGDAHGKSSSLITRRLKRLASTSSGALKSLRRSLKLQAGARLLREWQGESHEVEITGDGYRYRGEIYPSLSEIARLITGTRWSGPLFFGLRGNVPKATGRQRTDAPSYVIDLGSKRDADQLSGTRATRRR